MIFFKSELSHKLTSATVGARFDTKYNIAFENVFVPKCYKLTSVHKFDIVLKMFKVKC